MRAAAVQLTATARQGRATSRRPTGSCARAAADGAQLVVLPEKWTRARARAATCAPAPSRSTARRSRGRATPPRELGIDLVAGSIAERVDGRGQAAQHVACTSAPTARSRRVYRKIHMFDVEVDGTRLPRVRPRGRRATRPSLTRRPTASRSG